MIEPEVSVLSLERYSNGVPNTVDWQKGER